MKTEIKALVAKIVKSIVLIFGFCSLCAHGAGFSGAPYAQLDLDENPIVVTNVTFDGLVNNVASTTWEELKSLRDGSGLKPGQQYRITDYVATVGTFFYTTNIWSFEDVAVSAGHSFDIVVTAISSNALDEVARALRHDGDTYFPNTTKFEAWKIWYCIDNETHRFLWADKEKGKGVIYRMIDEFNNDVPYDFKSIQSIPSSQDNKLNTLCYVFSDDNEGGSDNSLKGSFLRVFNNKISPTYQRRWFDNEEDYLDGYYHVQALNLIHILGEDSHDNVFSEGCAKNVIYGSSNYFGEYCLNNFAEGSYNRFGNDCANNYLGNKSSSNTFGNSCYNNYLSGQVIRCSFGNGASENKIPEYCRALTLQNDVRSMELVLPSGTDYYRNVEFKSGLRNVRIEDTRGDMTYKYKVFKPRDSVEVSVVSPTPNVE